MSVYDDFPLCPVRECRPRVHQILETGGMASWFDGKLTRVISHIPALHRPLRTLPWPLSRLQPHGIEFRIFEGENWALSGAEPIHSHIYKRSEIATAIDEFLRGADPDHAVTFS